MLPQRRDHLGVSPAPRLRVDRGIDGLMADQAGRVIGMHGLELARNLLRRPAPVDQLAPHKIMQPAAESKLLPPSAALAARQIPRPAKLRAIGLGGQRIRTATPQFPADRRGAAPQKHADPPQARPAPMLRQNHAAFLTVEMLVSSVHRNILCPAGRGRCT